MNYWLVPILAQVVIPLEEAKTALRVANFVINLGSPAEPIHGQGWIQFWARIQPKLDEKGSGDVLRLKHETIILEKSGFIWKKKEDLVFI